MDRVGTQQHLWRLDCNCWFHRQLPSLPFPTIVFTPAGLSCLNSYLEWGSQDSPALHNPTLPPSRSPVKEETYGFSQRRPTCAAVTKHPETQRLHTTQVHFLLIHISCLLQRTTVLPMKYWRKTFMTLDLAISCIWHQKIGNKRKESNKFIIIFLIRG